MSNIEDPRLLWIKGGLFVLLGCIALSIVAIQSGSVQVVVASVISIWAFCRAYYFAFYVVEHYIDGRYRYAGLTSLLNYYLQERFIVGQEEGANPLPSDAPVRKASRWHAIRCWLILLCAPFAYWLFRDAVGMAGTVLRNELMLATDVALIGTWLGGLAFWMVRGVSPLSWRLLIGVPAAIYACALFSLFPYTIEYLWKGRFREPFDLRVFAACLSYFFVSIAAQRLVAVFAPGRLLDGLIPIEESKKRMQLSVLFFLCMMMVAALLLSILSRPYQQLSKSDFDNILEVVFFASLSGAMSATTIILLAKTILRTNIQSRRAFSPLFLAWLLFCPSLEVAIYYGWTGNAYVEDVRLVYGAYGIFYCANVLVMHHVKRSNITYV
jgi:hypothetical protein